MLDEKYIDVLESLDWRITDCYKDSCGTEYVGIENWSPAGEDLPVDFCVENFPEAVDMYAEDFDVDEHVELWIDGRGKRGVPESIRELVEDAEAIAKMFRTLADALLERKVEGPYTLYRCPDGSILLDYKEKLWTSGYPAFPKHRCTVLERGYCKGGPALAHFYAELKKKYEEV